MDRYFMDSGHVYFKNEGNFVFVNEKQFVFFFLSIGLFHKVYLYSSSLSGTNRMRHKVNFFKWCTAGLNSKCSF